MIDRRRAVETAGVFSEGSVTSRVFSVIQWFSLWQVKGRYRSYCDGRDEIPPAHLVAQCWNVAISILELV